MTARSDVEAVRRGGDRASWAPSGRAAVPAIVLLVIVANLVGVATVILLLVGVQDRDGDAGRATVLWAVAAYLVVALPAGTVAGFRRQRLTNRWLMARRAPTTEEAGYALRLPVDTALIAGLIWLVGAVLVAGCPRRPSPSRWSACGPASRPCSGAWRPPASPTCSSPAPPGQ